MLMLNKRATEADCRNHIIINPRWKLQNAKIKLAFARGLNDSSSLLCELDDTIIRCIREKIDRLPIRDPIWQPELQLVLTLPHRGGGKKRHKSKRRKSKRRKSKRRKSKRRKSKRRKSKQIKNTRRK